MSNDVIHERLHSTRLGGLGVQCACTEGLVGPQDGYQGEALLDMASFCGWRSFYVLVQIPCYLLS